MTSREVEILRLATVDKFPDVKIYRIERKIERIVKRENRFEESN